MTLACQRCGEDAVVVRPLDVHTEAACKHPDVLVCLACGHQQDEAAR